MLSNKELEKPLMGGEQIPSSQAEVVHTANETLPSSNQDNEQENQDRSIDVSAGNAGKDSGAEYTAQTMIKNVVQSNLDTDTYDLCWSTILGTIACCVPTCGPLISYGVAAGVDCVVAGIRNIPACKKEGQPNTIFLTNILDAFENTTANKPMKATDILPCGFNGVFAGMIAKRYKDYKAGDRLASVQSEKPVPSQNAMN